MQPYWQRQSKTEPLYDDMLWSRPENRAYAGKLMVAGGNVHGFAEPAQAYQAAMKAGIGTVRVMLPDSLEKTVGPLFPSAEFAPRTPSGSFARRALGEWINMASWADGVLLAGGMGRNSETAILMESFLTKYSGSLTVTKDSLDYFLETPDVLVSRPGSLLVATLSQLQKLAKSLSLPTAVTSTMDLVQLVELLHTITQQYEAAIVTKHASNFIVAVDGAVCTTKTDQTGNWCLETASAATVWWLQNPEKMYAGIVTSLVAD